MKRLRKSIFYGLFVFSPGNLLSILFIQKKESNSNGFFDKSFVFKPTTIVVFLFLSFFHLIPLISLSQSMPIDPSIWDITYSDDFNGTRNSEWQTLTGVGIWGDETFSSNTKYLTYGTEGSRQYLALKAYVDSDGGILKNFSAGISIPDKLGAPCTNDENPFFYGYYEIEAKITKNDSLSMNNIGLWPAFWFCHGETIGQQCNTTNKYWYEEVDIFEPGACQVKNDSTYVHYWTINDDNFPMADDFSNTWLDTGYVGKLGNVDMFNWHTYGVEWLPNRLTFYRDRIPFHTCTKRVPSHQKPHLYIDLQIDQFGCTSPKTTANSFIGSFLVNYFKYYALPTCSGEITETQGDNYNFANWSNAITNVKKYCIFKNSSLPSNSNVVIRSSDYVELKSNFTVSGAVLEIMPKPCN
jgi:beta-glucanase (GH16 family)